MLLSNAVLHDQSVVDEDGKIMINDSVDAIVDEDDSDIATSSSSSQSLSSSSLSSSHHANHMKIKSNNNNNDDKYKSYTFSSSGMRGLWL